MAGCGRNKQGNESDGFITVDATANYPEKELILQDFTDVEYIALETTDEFLTQGAVRAIGNKPKGARRRGIYTDYSGCRG